MKVIARLESKGYITKETRDYGGVKFCSMTVNLGGEHGSPVVNTVHQGSERRSPGGGEHGSPNNINRENIKEKKDKPISFSFLNSLRALGVSEKYAAEWLQVRKNKRLTNTETALNRIKAEIDKSGRSADDCIRIAVENSWGGFKAEWMPAEERKYETMEQILARLKK